jgi:DNA polymerase-3 subunit epsilon
MSLQEVEGAAPDSWVAIDFETASMRGTPCAVGLVEVEAGQIVGRHKWLIRPPVFEFSSFNIALHGITPEMCADASSWSDSLSRIIEIAGARPFVAHNASFDIGVIRDACDLSELAWPRLSYACTLVIGRRAWPGLTSYSLPFLAAHLGLSSDGHHDPGEDAAISAAIACAALSAVGVSSVTELASRVEAAMGSVEPDQWIGCHSLASSKTVPTEPTPGATIQPEHPLFGKTVTFTGAIAVPRREAQQAAVDRGAIAGKGVTRHTDYLVTGYQDLRKLAHGTSKSAKLKKAEKLRVDGYPVEIITESDFVHLLGVIASDPLGGKRAAFPA